MKFSFVLTPETKYNLSVVDHIFYLRLEFSLKGIFLNIEYFCDKLKILKIKMKFICDN